MNDALDLPLGNALDSIILLLTHEHTELYLRKFMRENGFVRFEELEPNGLGKRYRLYRR